MTDHLEPYRRMVRSIRFVPPLALKEQFHQSTQPMTPTPVVKASLGKIEAEATAAPAPGAEPVRSEHVIGLVQAAARVATGIPVVYAIPENIGDRINRLAGSRTVTPVIIAPKIPQPDPNWTPAPEYTQSKWQEHIEKAHTEAQTASPEPLEETPLDVAPTPTTGASETDVETVAVEEIPQQVLEEAPATAISESVAVEETPLDVAPTPTTGASETDAEAVAVEEIPQQVLEEAPATAISESVAVEETPLDVAPTPTTGASETDVEAGVKIQCPKCESTEISKNGHRNQKQRYLCKDCGKQFVLPDSLGQNEDKQTTKTSSVTTPAIKEPQSLNSADQRLSKNKKKAKGFGTGKTTK